MHDPSWAESLFDIADLVPWSKTKSAPVEAPARHLFPGKAHTASNELGGNAASLDPTDPRIPQSPESTRFPSGSVF